MLDQQKLKEELEQIQIKLMDKGLLLRKKILRLVKDYTNIKELKYVLLREMIDKIVIYERVPKSEIKKIDIY